MRQPYKTLLVWAGVIVACLAGWQFVKWRNPDPEELTYSEFLALVGRPKTQSRVEEVEVEGQTYRFAIQPAKGGTAKKGEAIGPPGGNVDELLKKGVKVKFAPTRSESWLTPFVSTLIPLLFVCALFALLVRQLQGAAGGRPQFARSRGKLFSESNTKIRFSDVGGMEAAKDRVRMLVEFLRDPKRFLRLGARVPKGILLVGPPGTGKTLLARAVAGEAGVPFFSVAGSEFVELFVGVGAARARDLFDSAKRHAPCIVFIDELDAIGRGRTAGSTSGANDERDQTLNQLLVELDGFESEPGVIILAATNRPEVLDQALLRPGRFDHRIEIPTPNGSQRRSILALHFKNKPHDATIDLEALAGTTAGMTGADLENLTNESALVAATLGAAELAAQHVRLALREIGLPIPARETLNGLRPALDLEVKRQTDAKDAIALALAQHYRGMARGDEFDPHKASVALLLGPPGSGKTLLVEASARSLGVPFARIDALSALDTRSTESIPEKIFRHLLKAARGKPLRAQYGIVCIENIQNVTGQGASHLLFEVLRRLVDGERLDVALSDSPGGATTSVQTRGVFFVLEGTNRKVEERARERSRESEGRFAKRTVLSKDLIEFDIPADFAEMLAAHSSVLSELEHETLFELAVERWPKVLASYELVPNALHPIRIGYQAIADAALQRKTGGHAIDAILHEIFAFASRNADPTLTQYVDREYVESAIYRTETPQLVSRPSRVIKNQEQVLEQFHRTMSEAPPPSDAPRASGVTETWTAVTGTEPR